MEVGEHWKRRLSALVGVLTVLGAVTAPASTAMGAHSDAHRNAAPRGTIIYSDWQFPDTLNPYEAGLAVDTQTNNLVMPVGRALYYDQKGQLVAGFLQKVPTLKNGGISKDGKTITLYVKPGLKWSNGDPITADDAKFAWQVAMQPAISICTGTCDNIKSITTKGKYEIIWHMKQVYSPAIPNAWVGGFLDHKWSKLGGTPEAAAAIMSAKTFTYEDSSYVTAGPYRVSNFVTNSRIELTPNNNYNGPGGKPKVAKYIFLYYPDKTTMIAGAARHETDLTQDYTLADLPALLGHRGDFTTRYVSALSPEHLELNMLDPEVNGQPNPLVNLKVRQAINLAIDRRGIIQSAFGVTKAKQQDAAISYDAPFVLTKSIRQPYADPAITGAWDPFKKKWLTYSKTTVADAKKLLAGTPCAHGCTVSLVTTAGNPQRAAEASVIQKNLGTIGITVDFKTVPAAQLFGTWKENGVNAHGTFLMTLFAYIGVQPDPDTWKQNVVSKFIDRLDPDHGYLDRNYSGLKDKIVDTSFDKASHTFNPALRRKYYYQAQVELSKQVPWIDVSVRPTFCTYDSNVKGVVVDGYAAACQWNGYDWKAGTQ
jgi:peptide/nickel transport system substrate-binding protein